MGSCRELRREILCRGRPSISRVLIRSWPSTSAVQPCVQPVIYLLFRGCFLQAFGHLLGTRRPRIERSENSSDSLTEIDEGLGELITAHVAGLASSTGVS